MNVLYQESGHLGARKKQGLAKTYSCKEGSFFEGRQQSTLKAKQSKAHHCYIPEMFILFLRLKMAGSTACSLEELMAAETSNSSEGHQYEFLLQFF